MKQAADASATGVRWLTIGAAHAGQRVDNYLIHILKGVPRSRIYRLLRTGQVRVNKGRAQPSRRLVAGDTVRVPPVQTEARHEVAPPSRLCQAIAASVLYEDERVVVVNKPSGIAVHRGSGIEYGIIEVMQVLRPECPHIALVHRLDRATSGCLLLAKDRRILPELNRLFSGRAVDKRYLALVEGHWRGGPRRISEPLRRLRGGGEHRMIVAADGKPAVTVFRPRLHLDAATLLEARLESGRMHQIRVHAAHIGHAVGGDEKYGSASFNRRLAAIGGHRLMLHAESLSLILPGERRPLRLHAPPGEDFERSWQRLGSRSA